MSEQTPPAMDYAEHERTYEGFLKLSKISSIAIGSILWALLTFTFGGGLGMFLGTVSIIAVVIGLVVSLFSKGDGVIPSGIVFGMCLLFFLVSSL